MSQMIAATPRIGFDRFIRLEWATMALRLRAGLADHNDLNEILDLAELGLAAKKKTRTVLNRLWLEPRSELVEFADRGVNIFISNPGQSAALCWGMSIVTYPFFGKVAELVGRLAFLQGDCASAEVHRRMSEIYGEREGTYRMTNMVLQSQENWGAISREQRGKRLKLSKLPPLPSEHMTEWLVEAVLRYHGKPLPIASLQSMPVIYPIHFDQPLAYLASKSSTMAVLSEGPSQQFVALRSQL